MKAKAERVDTRLENAQKACQCAAFLVDDLRSLNSSATSNKDGALSVLAIDLIGKASAIRCQLNLLQAFMEQNQ